MNMKYINLIVFLFVSSIANAEINQQSIPMQIKNNHTFYVPSSIEGTGPTSLLVDTGAGYSTITEKTLRKLQKAGNVVYLKKLEGVMADGSVRKVSVYRISAINIGNSCLVRDIEVAVFPSGTREILGLNTLSKVAPFTFYIDPPSLSLSNCSKV
jgi:predicted aspartyl protease